MSNPDYGLEAIKTGINEAKKSVSDGKAKVAAAISAKGIPTAADSTFDTLASNIGKIVTLGSGSADASATAAQILSGYSAYVKGVKVNGSIKSLGAQTITPGTAAKTIAANQYLSGVQTIAGDANLVAGNIAKGKSIFGVAGSYEGNSRFLEGTASTSINNPSTAPTTLLTINNVPFTPKYVILYINKMLNTNGENGIRQQSTNNYEHTQFIIPYGKKVTFSAYQSGLFINTENNISSSVSSYLEFNYVNNTVTVIVHKYSGSYACIIYKATWSYIIIG